MFHTSDDSIARTQKCHQRGTTRQWIAKISILKGSGLLKALVGSKRFGTSSFIVVRSAGNCRAKFVYPPTLANAGRTTSFTPVFVYCSMTLCTWVDI